MDTNTLATFNCVVELLMSVTLPISFENCAVFYNKAQLVRFKTTERYVPMCMYV